MDQREIARKLYTSNKDTASSLAATMGVEQQQVQQWIDEGKWDVVRSVRAIDPACQVQRMYHVLASVNDSLEAQPNLKDADQALKLTAAIKNLEHDRSLTSIIAAAEEFITWLYDTDVPAAQQFTRHFDQFISQRAA